MYCSTIRSANIAIMLKLDSPMKNPNIASDRPPDISMDPQAFCQQETGKSFYYILYYTLLPWLGSLTCLTWLQSFLEVVIARMLCYILNKVFFEGTPLVNC